MGTAPERPRDFRGMRAPMVTPPGGRQGGGGHSEPPQDIQPEESVCPEATRQVGNGHLADRDHHPTQREPAGIDNGNTPQSAVNADKVAPLPRTLQVVPQPLRGCHTHRGDQCAGVDEQRTRHFGRKRDHDDGHAVSRHKGYPVRVVPGQNTITASESGSVTGPAKKTAVRTPGCARAKANSSA